MSTEASGGSGPDFIGIGVPISGTTWLYQSLRKHSSVWMSEVKEFHYLDSQRTKGRASPWFRPHLELFLRVTASKALRGDFSWQLGWWSRYLLGSRNDEWYASLFAQSGRAISGEITPRYAYLPEQTIAEFARRFPRTRILLMLRDPVERSWSYATKRLAVGKARHMADVSEAEIDDFFERDRFQGGIARWNDYASIVDRWSACFPSDQIWTGYYDDLAASPVDVLAEVCNFLEIPIEGFPEEQALKQRYSSSQEAQIEIPPAIARHIAGEVVTGLQRLSERVGGHPSRWLSRAESLLDR